MINKLVVYSFLLIMPSFSFALDNVDHNVGSRVRCFNLIGLSYGYDIYQNINPKQKSIKYSSKIAIEFIAEALHDHKVFNIEIFDGIIGVVLNGDDSVSSISKSISITDCDNDNSLANNDLDKFLSDSIARGETLLYVSNKYNNAPGAAELKNYVQSPIRQQKSNARRTYIINSWKKKEPPLYRSLDIFYLSVMSLSYDEANMLKIAQSMNAVFWIDKSGVSNYQKLLEDSEVNKKIILSWVAGFVSGCAIIFYFTGSCRNRFSIKATIPRTDK